jgi:hypothetical protein
MTRKTACLGQEMVKYGCFSTLCWKDSQRTQKFFYRGLHGCQCLLSVFSTNCYTRGKGVVIGAAILINAVFFEEMHKEHEVEEDAFFNFLNWEF